MPARNKKSVSDAAIKRRATRCSWLQLDLGQYMKGEQQSVSQRDGGEHYQVRVISC